MEHVISIGPSGLVKAMHNDRFSMGFLGEQSIQRASEIVWQKDQQRWSIEFYIDGEFVPAVVEYQGFDSYDAARAFEVNVMNHCMKEQMSPSAPAVLKWAAFSRCM